jgi:hypothetical protein
MSESQEITQSQNNNPIPNQTVVSTPNVQPVEEQPNPVVEEQPNPVVEEQPNPVVEEQPNQVVEEQPNPVVEEKIIEEQPNQVVEEKIIEEQPNQEPPVKEEITIKIDKSTLVALSQNLNTNLIVNISAYTSVLDKLKNSETDETRKNALEANIQSLNQIKQSAVELLSSVQTSLDVSPDQKIDAESISKQVPGSPESSSLMNKLFSSEVAAILGTMTAATVVMLGGARRKKMTKRRRNKGKKSTKRTKA